jgi:AcrR family transcriptional regulator
MVGKPNRDRRAERREATRQEILAAAWDVAHLNGVAGLTLREVAVRVGMQPPSLYSHFESKNAIYDAMFAQGWQQLNERIVEVTPEAPAEPRARLAFFALTFFDFALEDTARSQLMNVRILPDFAPSPEAYQPALDSLDIMRRHLRDIGIRRAADADLFTALVAGLISQQQANDPGGTRWRDLVPRAVDMFADQLGLPGRPISRRKP